MPHIHEKVDFTVEVFVVFKNKVLLRMHDKYGFWLSVGGHVELDEDPNEAALREVMEEVGLEVSLVGGSPAPQIGTEYRELIPPKFLNRHRVSDTHEHVTLVYFARANTDKVNPSEGEGSEVKWVTAEELDNEDLDLKKDIRFYAKEALKELAK